MIGDKVKFRKFNITLQGIIESYSIDDSLRVIYLRVRCKFGSFKVYPENLIFIGEWNV